MSKSSSSTQFQALATYFFLHNSKACYTYLFGCFLLALSCQKMELSLLTLHRVAFPAVHYTSKLLLWSQDAYLQLQFMLHVTMHVTSRLKQHIPWYLHLLE